MSFCGANDLFKGNDSSDKKANSHRGSNLAPWKMALICEKGFSGEVFTE
jgi:hypothetical protein